MLSLAGKRLPQPLLRMRNSLNNAGHMQRRGMHPVGGPPETPLSGAEQWILGGGFLIAIMIIPTWGLYSVPRWAEIHKKAD